VIAIAPGLRATTARGLRRDRARSTEAKRAVLCLSRPETRASSSGNARVPSSVSVPSTFGARGPSRARGVVAAPNAAGATPSSETEKDVLRGERDGRVFAGGPDEHRRGRRRERFWRKRFRRVRRRRRRWGRRRKRRRGRRERRRRRERNDAHVGGGVGAVRAKRRFATRGRQDHRRGGGSARLRSRSVHRVDPRWQNRGRRVFGHPVHLVSRDPRSRPRRPRVPVQARRGGVGRRRPERRQRAQGAEHQHVCVLGRG
jgi:hypothetical protein